MVALAFLALLATPAYRAVGQAPGLPRQGRSETRPTAYRELRIEAWRVLVEAAIQQDHPSICDDTLAELRSQLREIVRKVPAGPLVKLQAVPIWIHRQSETRCMAYHPSERWLREHGFNPGMARAIEIGNAANFLSWTKEQPWMVLHELAHAYHDQVLSFENPRIRQAWENAVKTGRYDSVLHVLGQRRKHYALNNPKEYFAESSEAYFGVNDFYPFVRGELKEHDPEMYQLLAELWR